MRILLAMSLSLASSIILASGAGSPAQAESVKNADETIAATITAQGLACSNPVVSLRNRDEAQPKQLSWVLICEEGRYLVRFKSKYRADEQTVGTDKR